MNKMEFPKLNIQKGKDRSMFNLDKFREEVQARLSFARESVGKDIRRSYMNAEKKMQIPGFSSEENNDRRSLSIEDSENEDLNPEYRNRPSSLSPSNRHFRRGSEAMRSWKPKNGAMFAESMSKRSQSR